MSGLINSTGSSKRESKMFESLAVMLRILLQRFGQRDNQSKEGDALYRSYPLYCSSI
jgi:hypothetical protein